jgi:hypothetical protein
MKAAGKTIGRNPLRSLAHVLNRPVNNAPLPQARKISRGRAKGFRWMATSSSLLLLVVACCPNFAHAQSATPQTENAATTTKNASELLTTLDQLVEQNRQLEKQNQELMNQINSLHQFLVNHPGAATDTIQKESGDAKPAVAATAPNHMEEAKSSSDVLPNPSEPGEASHSSSTQSSANKDQQVASASPNAPSGEEYGRNTTWNLYEPGRGFDIAKTEYGSLNISGYLVARYLNQFPVHQSFVDHNGQTQPVDTRQDFQLHRVMLYFTGYLGTPKFNYNVTLWTVNDTAQVAIVGALYYAANKHFLFGVGWNGIPGTRSMQGSHPYWSSYDRVMADEFFRPYFTQAFFAEGALGHRFSYKFTIGNNLSNLDISAVKLTRDLSKGVSLTWMPTTGEFGPRGAFGDYEGHESFATRFGVAYSTSREDRFNSTTSTAPDNTTIRLGDSLLLFATGSLAPQVTVQKATYQLLSSDAGLKYKGLWLQGEGYYRLLDKFLADGILPVSAIRDFGFYVQGSYMLLPKKFEIYGSTSWVFTKFHPQDVVSPHEFIGGLNWYPTNSRNYRLNLQAANVYRSSVSSTFGFYTGGLKGISFAIGATTLF